jgi:tRNA(Ile)-lysidine synthetase-like protein
VLDDSAFHKGNVVCQGYGIALKVRGDTLVGMSEVALKRKKGYAIVVEAPGDYKLPQKICFHIEEKLLSSYSRDKIQLTKKLMKPPFLVRSRQPGDVIALQGGRKTIKKLLGEWKVPDDQRWEIPILEDRSGIIAVCGKPFGYKNRVAEKWKRCNIRVDEYIYEISFSA